VFGLREVIKEGIITTQWARIRRRS